MSSTLEILELRVHGVRNTPPHEMLGVEPGEEIPAEIDGIKLVDHLAGFYRRKQTPLGTSTTLEAYSWGKLNRFAPPGLVSKTSRAFYNIGWFLVAPFGFANVAYWGRVVKADDRREGGVDPGTGAALVRLFSLILTLLLASSIATVVMDFVAVQCYRVRSDQGREVQQVCNSLPSWFDGLRDLTRGQRLAAVSPFPIIAVALLAVIGVSSDMRFRTKFRDKQRMAGESQDHAVGKLKRWKDNKASSKAGTASKYSFVLAAPRLWIRRENSPTGVLHIAAAIQLVTFLLTADVRSTTDLTSRLGVTIFELSTFFFVLSCVVLAAITAIVTSWGARSVRAPDRDLQGPRSDPETTQDDPAGEIKPTRMAVALNLLGASFGVYLGAVLVACFSQKESERADFTAAQLIPTVLVALLSILAASGFLMRLEEKAAVIWGVVTGLVSITVIAIIGLRWHSTPLPVNAAFGLCALCVLAVSLTLLNQNLERRFPARPFGRKAEAWYGMGPGVMMFLSLLFASFYASAIVVGAGNWLKGGALVWQQNPDNPLFRDLLKDGTDDITVPFLYWATGGVMVLMVLVAVLIQGVIMLRRVGKGQWITDPLVDGSEGRYERDIFAVRRRSALLQRGEPVVAVAAAATFAGVLLALVLTVGHQNGKGNEWLQHLPYGDILPNAATWVTTSALTAAGLLVLGAAVGSAAIGGTRPLGLLWDLVAWLPRAGHPFGPACYAERAVPELADRMIQWLTKENVEDEPTKHKPGVNDRRILLSTHSLGAVLGIAALYHLKAINRGELLPQIRLLTFGVQLRPYFGRFFPDFWGPAVLGTPGIMSPKAFESDPWKGRELLNMTGSQGVAAPEQLVNLLKGGSKDATTWLNVWRRTDYLGFPVNSYTATDNTIDLTALEIEPDSYQALIATHSNYFRTKRYSQAREALIENWELPTPNQALA